MKPFEQKLEKNTCKTIKKLIEETRVPTYQQCNKDPNSSSCLSATKYFASILSKFKTNQCENYYPFENGDRCSTLLSILYYNNNNIEKCIEYDSECQLYKMKSDHEKTFSEFEMYNCGTKYR